MFISPWKIDTSERTCLSDSAENLAVHGEEDVNIGAIIGLIFGSANHPIESLGTPIFVMLLIEFLG